MDKNYSVLFFCYGNSSDASTWSNVPYCLGRALEGRGIDIIRIDISPDARLESLWNTVVHRILNVIWRGNLYFFERSFLANAISNRKIRDAMRRNPDAELAIFTSFSFYNKFDDRPSVLLCDWTFESYINDRFHRKPFFFERWYIKQQSKAILGAQHVVSLFCDQANKMSLRYPQANICWLGRNVINNLYDGVIDNSIISEKLSSNVILFIGRPAYIQGAELLAKAMKQLWKVNPNMELHCIGIETNQLSYEDPRIKCYGYLRKDDTNQNALYYSLLRKARIISNPTPEWAGYSSTIEAMFFYTPVLVTRYQSFVDEFGDSISFGEYVKEFSPEMIARQIQEVIGSADYAATCESSHAAVKDYTWDSYVQDLLDRIQRSK